jgi:hypothetical protein
MSSTYSKVQFSKTHIGFGCDKDKVCITGHHPINTDITLLDINGKKFCSAKVEKSDDYSDEATYFKRSFLKNLKNCSKPLKAYKNAINKRVKSFSVIDINGKKSSTKLPGQEVTNFLKEAKSVEQWIKGKRVPFNIFSFNKIESTSRKIKVNDTQISLIESQFYKKGKVYATGAYMIRNGDNYTYVSDLCTRPKETNLLKIDQFLYLKTDSFCCECGWQAEQYYEIKKDSVRKVSTDASSST